MNYRILSTLIFGDKAFPCYGTKEPKGGYLGGGVELKSRYNQKGVRERGQW